MRDTHAESAPYNQEHIEGQQFLFWQHYKQNRLGRNQGQAIKPPQTL